MSMAPTTGPLLFSPVPRMPSSHTELLPPSSAHHSSQSEETRIQGASL
uniref:Uncharacterized protein n=1 Tax=Arundo donax TaxID=35708 RepID=A0A0A9ENT5_ARUDO